MSPTSVPIFTLIQSALLDISVVKGRYNETDFDTRIQVFELEKLDTSETPAETCSRAWI